MIRDAATLRVLADLLDYPGPELALRAAAVAAAAGGDERLARLAAAARTGGAALEEAYVAAFDVAPVASPYVGDQLFGAGPERARLLAALRELRRDAGVAAGTELPDHVSEVLRLCAAPIPEDVRDDLVRDGIAPTLQRMRDALAAAGNPWADPVAAVLDALAPRAAARRAGAQEVAP